MCTSGPLPPSFPPRGNIYSLTKCVHGHKNIGCGYFRHGQARQASVMGPPSLVQLWIGFPWALDPVCVCVCEWPGTSVLVPYIKRNSVWENGFYKYYEKMVSVM